MNSEEANPLTKEDKDANTEKTKRNESNLSKRQGVGKKSTEKSLSNSNDQILSKSTGTLMDVIQTNIYYLVSQMPSKNRLYQNSQVFYSAPIFSE